jgi:hypothetical protein
MMLDRPSWVLLQSALCDAIKQEDDFVELARRLEWSTADVIGFNFTGRRIIQAFIERAEAQDRVLALLGAAREISQGNQMLARIKDCDLVLIDPAPRAGTAMTHEERAQIAIALSSSFGDAELESIVRAVQPDRSSAWQEGPPTKASMGRFVEAASDEGWFFALLRKAIEQAPAGSNLAAIGAEVAGPVVATLPATEDAWKQALQRQRFTGGYFMINRTKLRSSMGLMMPAVGNRILVVRGDPKTGLSHSVRLLSYLREVCGGLTLALVDLEEAARDAGPAKTLSPRHLAKAITRELGYDDLALPDEPNARQWPAWNSDFAREFAKRADDDPRRVFLVLDAFHKVPLNRATIDLVEVLSKYVGTRVTAFRLVLVGFSGELPDDVRQARLVDETGALTKADLVEFFAKVYAEANVEIDQFQLTQKVRAVLKGQKAYPPGSLLDLSDRVQDELRELPQ